MTTDHGEMAADSELSSRSMDISKMLTKCEELVAQFQYDLAIKFCDRILSLEPTQLDALHLKATILIDMGDGEAAKPVPPRHRVGLLLLIPDSLGLAPGRGDGAAQGPGKIHCPCPA